MKKIITAILMIASTDGITAVIDFRPRTVEPIYTNRIPDDRTQRLDCDLRGYPIPPKHEKDGWFIARVAMHSYHNRPNVYHSEDGRYQENYQWVSCDMPSDSILGTFNWNEYSVSYGVAVNGPSVNLGTTAEYTQLPYHKVPTPVFIEAKVIDWQRARLENLRIERGTYAVRGTIVPVEPGEYKITVLLTATLK